MSLVLREKQGKTRNSYDSYNSYQKGRMEKILVRLWTKRTFTHCWWDYNISNWKNDDF